MLTFMEVYTYGHNGASKSSWNSISSERDSEIPGNPGCEIAFRTDSIRPRLVVNYLCLVAAGDANRKWPMAILGPIPDLNRK